MADKPANLVEAIGIPATLEQMAEEATELTHACQKLSRDLRGENLVHGRTREKLIKNLIEEMADCYVTMGEVRKITGLVDNEELSDTIDQKRKRMRERLGIESDSFIF